MNEIIRIGPFILKYELLVTIIGGLIGYLFLLFRIKRMSMDKQVITDTVLGTVLLGVLVWKFGDVLFNPSIIWTNPFSVLYLGGNGKTLLIAMLSSGIYLFYKIRIHKIHIYQFLDLLPFGFLPFLFVYNLAVPSYGYKTGLPWGVAIPELTQKYHPVNFYFAAIIAGLFLFIMRKKEQPGSGRYFTRTVAVLGLSGIFLSFFAPQDIKLIGLSINQLLYIILVLIGVLLYRKNENGSASGAA